MSIARNDRIPSITGALTYSILLALCVLAWVCVPA
jgi:hypothetical protein